MESDLPRKLRPLFLLLALAWEGMIYLLSSLPGGTGPYSPAKAYIYNGGHAFLYAVLAGLIVLGLPKRSSSLWIAILLATLLGATDEWHQSFVPRRAATVSDWFTDCAGAAFGTQAAWMFRSAALTRPRPLLALATLAMLCLLAALNATI